MKYISHWTVPQSSFNAAVKRFLETGGAPPKGLPIGSRCRCRSSPPIFGKAI